MGKRGANKGTRKFNTKPGSTTPWYYNDSTFTPKQRGDRRGDSEFFSEFSTESLFANGVPGSPGASVLHDPYEVLGLFPGASLDQVKKAHRKLAKRYHPDRVATASEAEQRHAQVNMVRVNAAYAELMSRVAPDQP